MPRNRKRKRAKLAGVSVRSERRAEPDFDKFAWALLQYAKTVQQQPVKQRSERDRS